MTRAAPRLDMRVAATVFAAAASFAFLLARPPVGDFWAAQARQSAARHGVGLGYWFSWFGGTVPGHYSVLIPFVSRFVDLALLGATSTVVITVLTFALLRGSRHPVAGTWLAAVGSSVSLWSGRIPFAAGTALMLVTLLCVRADRRCATALAAVITTLVSPVSGAFLVLGLTGVCRHDRSRRVAAATAMAVSCGSLLVVALRFSSPGPEGFPAVQAWGCAAALAAMLLAKPPPYIRMVLVLALLACPVVALVPNGLGGNFERLAWICLPVATLATAQARAWVAGVATCLAVSVGLAGSAHDLYVAAQPMSTLAYSQGLVSEMGRIPDLPDYRVEVVPDGTHVAAYALLGHVLQARGFETQSDNALDGVLNSPNLTPATFRDWLDRFAVGYVAIDRRTLRSGPEDRLVRSGTLPYLRRQWADNHWILWRVTSPRPLVSRPARVVASAQARITVAATRAARLGLRVRWSRFLRVQGAGARLVPGRHGWTTLIVPRAGRYLVEG